MLPFIVYEGKVALAIIAFYLFWRLLLRKETFHRLNRAVLVGTVVLSFILPFIVITVKKSVDAVPSSMTGEDLPAIISPEGNLALVSEGGIPYWQTALILVYITGVVFVLGRILISTLSIRKILRSCSFVKKEDGYNLFICGKDVDPFSWMNNIVLSEKDSERDSSSIITHEKAHIRNRHSAELLLVDILSSLQWFNPAIWSLRSDLQEIHEYEADEAVLRSGADIKEYQYLLIRKAVSKSGYSVANSFNHSILKNRITMMSKSKSSPGKGLRAAYILPLVCLGLVLQARTVYVPMDKDNEISSTQRGRGGFLEPITVVRYAEKSITPSMIKHVDDQYTASQLSSDPKWNSLDSEPSCSENFSFWLNQRILYPKDCLTEGTVIVSFKVGKDGKVRDAKIEKSVCDELDNMLLSLVNESPRWTPAKMNGKSVEVKMLQPVTFRINIPSSTTSSVADPTSFHTLEVSQGQGNTPSVTIDGKKVPAGKIGETVKEMGLDSSSEALVIKADADLPMGSLDMVKDELRKAGALRVMYMIPEKQSPTTKSGNNTALNTNTSKEMLSFYKTREATCLISINADDEIFWNEKAVSDEDLLKEGKAFLKKNGKKSTFALIYDKNATSAAFNHASSLVQKIYAQVKDDEAKSRFGKSYASLPESQKKEITDLYPLKLVELD
ncbi:MAG: TonB family protein [Bacteroidales bacterium]|nr:TonB family protein [Bacteroidales bacterium]